jgi:hypothetical protein
MSKFMRVGVEGMIDQAQETTELTDWTRGLLVADYTPRIDHQVEP